MLKHYLKIFFMILINYFLLFTLSLIIKLYLECLLKDSLFVIGLISLFLSIFAISSGNSLGLSIRSLGQLNAQYSGRMDLEAKKNEKESFKLNVNLKELFKSTILFCSILIILTSIIVTF